MTTEESVLERLRTLPPARQQEVLEFVESLGAAAGRPLAPRRSFKGLCADLGISISEADFEEARREMWSGFPREMD